MSLRTASIAQHCKALRLPSFGAQFASLAEEAGQRNHSHLHYLEALLQAEVEDRERRTIELRIKEAHLPRIKTLEEFDFAQSPHIAAARIRALAEGGYLERAEPVLLVGDPGTGKRVISLPAWRLRPAVNANECALPLPPRWSTSSSRRNGNRG
jgi:DNA replication protein DnaC